MDKEFIPYEQALALKLLGFAETCFDMYSANEKLIGGTSLIYETDIKAPLYQQAFRWFREKYDVICHIHKPRGRGYTNEHYFDIWPKDMDDYEKWNGKASIIPVDYYDSYEEAELACLKKLIEVVKNEKM